MIVLRENNYKMNLFHSFFECLRNSKRIIHVAVFLACIGISGYQLAQCLRKLQQPPVSTHYRFAINKTLNYPAVTVCRNPPYKSEVLKNSEDTMSEEETMDYGSYGYNKIGMKNSSVEHTSEWRNFPFDKATLQQVWDNATYREDEVIKLYGLHGESANAEVLSNYYFYHGRCFTFVPRVGATQPWPNSGWSIMLQHQTAKNQEGVSFDKPQRLGSATNSEIDGFHVYVHEVREPWTENMAQTKFIVNYMYVEVGEEVELKINADEFRGISTHSRPCLNDPNYSRYKCIEQRWWTNISRDAGCTVPWMRGVVGLPHCNKYEPLLNLINSYSSFSDINDNSCPHHPCNVTTYKLQVQKRQQLLAPFSHLYVYFTSKMVTVMQELPGYDTNEFISDMGGSLGFFLGLSVIGAIDLLEKSWGVLACLARPRKAGKEEVGMEKVGDMVMEKS